ncbi:MAG: DNA repair exonuclease [Alphaproteobacteria bacterium]|jgi:DNA repair exonuclease SbcCD nuclease subunit
MSDFKFLHAADIHLDSPMLGLSNYDDAPAEAMRGATRQALKNLVALAIDEACAFVLIAGDLFDGSQRDVSTALFFAKEMSRLGKHDIRVYLIYGNHDAETQLKSMPWPDNVKLLGNRKAESVPVPGLEVTIHGRSFAKRDEDRNLAADYPAATADRFNIGILHTALTGHAGHAYYAPCTLDDLLGKNYDYWALGHVHDFSRRHEDPPIIYCGNLQGRNVRETGPKGAVLVTVVDGGVSVAHRVLDAARWEDRQVDLTATTSLEQMMGLVRTHLDSAADLADGRVVAVRLTLTGRTPLHGEISRQERSLVEDIHVMASGLGRDVWVEKIQFQTEAMFTIDEIAARDDAIGDLAARLGSAGQDEDLMALIGNDAKALVNKLPADLSAVLSGDGARLLQAVGNDDLDQLVKAAGIDLVAQLTEAE